jgi:hypothetical protein
MRNLLRSTQEAQFPSATSSADHSSPAIKSRREHGKLQESAGSGHFELLTQATRIHQYLQQTVHQDIEQTGLHLLNQVERAYHLCRHIEAELQAHNGMMTTSNIQGLRSLEIQLKGLRKDAQVFQKKTTENLTEIDTRISHFLTAARLMEPTRTSHLTVTQVQDLTRLAERFAQDVTTLARSLRRITQEMQASLAPFRLDAIENGPHTLQQPPL